MAKLHKYESMGAHVEMILHAKFVIETMLSLRQCNKQEIKQNTYRGRGGLGRERERKTDCRGEKRKKEMKKEEEEGEGVIRRSRRKNGGGTGFPWLFSCLIQRRNRKI